MKLCWNCSAEIDENKTVCSCCGCAQIKEVTVKDKKDGTQKAEDIK